MKYPFTEFVQKTENIIPIFFFRIYLFVMRSAVEKGETAGKVFNFVSPPQVELFGM
jgi:hypothetical protein